ncbi:hypothetical protein [Micromonospora sp. NPDC049662]|uniref:hypothetical protein n=1 Tax=Micromonospora sp. NPDC049662 TaxID=3155397 RepID=UPI00341672C5
MAQTGSRAAGAQSTPAPQTQSTPKTDADRVRELEAEVAKLREQSADADALARERDRYAAEVAKLREQVTATGEPATSTMTVSPPTEPKFTFSEGQRDELERDGRTVSPFTGKRYVGTSVDDAREATADEFANAKAPKPAEK